MNSLYVMISILGRRRLREFLKFYEDHGVSVNLVTLGYGTARDDMLSYLGLDAEEKVAITSFVTYSTWRRLKHGLQTDMDIDLPGTGIAFIVPMSSIGGGSQLAFVVGEQEFEKTEESILKNTKYELLIVVSNIGYADEIMEAARTANAGGGTVLHAKGTGMQGAEKFFGVTLASEKEMVYIVVRSENKNNVMRAIMDSVGINSRAQSVVFSLPVTSTAGIRFAEMKEG